MLEDVIWRHRNLKVAPKSVNQKRYVDAIRSNTITFGVGPAGTGKTFLAMAMATAALSRREVNRIILTRPAVEAGERLGFLPGDLMAKVDPYLRPLFDALHDMMDAEQRRSAPRARRDRGRAAGVHARTDAQRLVRHPRRGAEHLAGADEDVPDAAGLRLEDGRDRRHHADRPAARPALGPRRGLRHPAGVDGIEFVRFGGEDVVRHKLVQRIVAAYDEHSKRQAPELRSAGTAAPRRLSGARGRGDRLRRSPPRRSRGPATLAAGAAGVAATATSPSRSSAPSGSRAQRASTAARTGRRTCSRSRSTATGAPLGERELGDVVICPEHTEDLLEAVVHGVLHLTGHGPRGRRGRDAGAAGGAAVVRLR